MRQAASPVILVSHGLRGHGDPIMHHLQARADCHAAQVVASHAGGGGGAGTLQVGGVGAQVLLQELVDGGLLAV